MLDTTMSADQPRPRDELYEQLRDEVRDRQHVVEQLAVNVHEARIDRDRWRRIALRLALAGDGSYRRLSTEERDALEAGLVEYRRDEATHEAAAPGAGQDAGGGGS